MSVGFRDTVSRTWKLEFLGAINSLSSGLFGLNITRQRVQWMEDVLDERITAMLEEQEEKIKEKRQQEEDDLQV